MALSAPMRALPRRAPSRPGWLHAGLLFGAVAAGVLLTSGHAQAATPAPISAPNTAVLPAPVVAPSATVLPMAPSVLPVAPRGNRVVPSVVSVERPVRTAVASAHEDLAAVVHAASAPTVTSLTAIRPVVTETAAAVRRFVAPLPASDLAVTATVLQTSAVSSVTGLAKTLAHVASGPTAAASTFAGGRAASSSSALLLAVALADPVATWPEPIAPTPPAPAPASPAPTSPAGAAGSGAAQAAFAVAIDPVAVAPPQASRPVRRARTDGSCAFVVSIVEWPG